VQAAPGSGTAPAVSAGATAGPTAGLLIGTLIGALAAAALAQAAPDGVDWTIAATDAACAGCHLGSDPVSDPAALRLLGLPAVIEPGREYPLTIVLEDPALRNAGFLLTIRAGSNAAGTLKATDDRVETLAAQARSSWQGSFPPGPGRASWTLLWQAPAVADAGIRFDLWANAGNDDLSPLGDRLHHRTFDLAALD
jgi:hypothetical protein